MVSPDDLRAMDLKKKGANDECLAYGQWTRIHAVHTLAKATTYQANFPVDDGDWWRHVKPNPATPGTINTPKCNLPVVVARLSAIIPAGGQHNSVRNVEDNGSVEQEADDVCQSHGEQLQAPGRHRPYERIRSWELCSLHSHPGDGHRRV